MNPFDPQVQSLAWTLLHFLWQGSLVWACTALALRFCWRSRAQVRYSLALLGLVACLLLPVGTYLYLHPRALAQASIQSLPEPASAPTAPSVPISTQAMATPNDPSMNLDRFLPWIVRGWFIGSLLLALRLSGGWIGLRWLSRKGQAGPDAWWKRLDRMARALGLWHTPRMLLSNSITSPLVVGWIRPILMVPAGLFTGLDPTAVEALLAHELAHIRRHDYLVNLVQCVVEILLFYHPAVWWISRRIRIEREHCCDDVAVAWCEDPLLFAEALNHLRERPSRSPMPAMAAGGGDLMFRIKRLLAPEAIAPVRARRTYLPALLCAFSLITLAGYSTRSLKAESATFKPSETGWFLAGSNRKDYRFETDPTAARGPFSSLLLTTDKKDVDGFGTLMQMQDATPYLGKRVRLSAWVRNENVVDWAGLWMRVDSERGSTAFDNMGQRPIKGTLPWTRYEVVLDVAPDSKKLAFGLLLGSPGKTWLNDVRLEVVDASVPVTDTAGGPPSLAQGAMDPNAWGMAGSRPNDYTTRLDASVPYAGKPTHVLASTADTCEGFGTVMQMFQSKAYLGKRVRLSAWVKAEGVSDWAGLWLRIDGAEKTLAFDNMEKRPIKGNTDWRRCEVVLDVAQESRGIALGILLNGKGKVWMTEPTLEIVGTQVPSTSMF